MKSKVTCGYCKKKIKKNSKKCPHCSKEFKIFKKQEKETAVEEKKKSWFANNWGAFVGAYLIPAIWIGYSSVTNRSSNLLALIVLGFAWPTAFFGNRPEGLLTFLVVISAAGFLIGWLIHVLIRKLIKKIKKQ